MATVGQNIGQTLEEQNLEFYCDCIERKRNKELKPLSGLVALNLRQRAALGWNKVHNHILKLPFCIRTAVSMDVVIPVSIEQKKYIKFRLVPQSSQYLTFPRKNTILS